MSDYDVIIKGGTIIDGRRNPRYLADVGIKDGIIARIGGLNKATADRVIDATGLNVAPGVVDLHTHYDSQIFWDPYCSTSGWHGATSVVIGNCGFGFAPVRPDARDRAMLSMTRNEAVPLATMQEGMPWDWETFPEFLDSIARTPKSVNVLALVPLNPLMIYVMGLDRAKSGVLPTDEEHAEMVRLLHEAMDAGANGISAQRLGVRSVQRDYDGLPLPTDLMHDETMLVFARALGERGEGIIQYTYIEIAAHLSGDVDYVKNTVQPHIEEVARISGRPVIVGGAGEADGPWVQSCQERGLRIYGVYVTTALDATPITATVAESPSSFDIALSWTEATVGTHEEVKAKFADPEVRAKMRGELALMEATFGKISDWVLLRAATPEYDKFSQKPLGAVAAEMGMDEVDAFCEINIREDLRTKWYRTVGGTESTSDDQGNNSAFLQGLEPYKAMGEDPWAIPGISDGGAHTKYLTTGNYPTHYLVNFVRKHGWLSLEEAHYKLSALPAFVAGFHNRGVIAEGAPADIMIYDFDKLGIGEVEELHDYPADEWRVGDRPIGMRYVLVNGQVTLEDNNETNATPGQLIYSRGRLLETAGV
jgi:N-acyl-D-aspartate/D-glutamate deacylase